MLKTQMNKMIDSQKKDLEAIDDIAKSDEDNADAVPKLIRAVYMRRTDILTKLRTINARMTNEEFISYKDTLGDTDFPKTKKGQELYLIGSY